MDPPSLELGLLLYKGRYYQMYYGPVSTQRRPHHKASLCFMFPLVVAFLFLAYFLVLDGTFHAQLYGYLFCYKRM